MANAVEFVIKARDEASAALQRVSGGVTDLRGAFGSLVTGGGPVGIATAAFVGIGAASIAAASNIAQTVEELDMLAAKTGVNIESLQVFKRAITDAGGDANGLEMALVNLNRSIATDDKLLKDLGITSKNTEDAFKQLSVIFGNSDDTAKKTEIAMRLLGKAGADLVGIMPQVASAFDGTRRQMDATGQMIGDGPNGVASQARKLDEEMDQLSNNWAGFLTRMQSATVGPVSVMIDNFNKFWDAFSGKELTQPEKEQSRIDRLQEVIDAEEAGLRKIKSIATQSSAEWIADRERTIEQLKLQLGKLKGLRAETQDEEDDIMRALDRVAQGKGASGDKIAGVKLDNEKPAAETPREREIKRIADLLGKSKEIAAQVVDQLDKISEGKAKQDLIKRFTDAGVVPPAGTGLMIDLPEQELPTMEVSNGWQAFNESLTEIYDKVESIKDPMAELGQQWSETIADLTSTSGIAGAGLDALFNGLQTGISQVFSNLTNKAQTFKSAMATIFKAIADQAIAALSRIIATKIFEFIVTLITGSSFLGAAAGKGLGVAMEVPSSGTAIVTPVPGGDIAMAAGTNIYISALDRAGIESALRDVRGGFGMAVRDAAYSGAY